MLNSEKKNCALRDKQNKYSDSRVVRKNISERKKTHTPPLCKLNGRSLSDDRKISLPQQYIWDDSSKARLEYDMSGSDFQLQISEFVNLDISLDRDDINIATSQLENIVLNTAKGSLRKPKSKTNKKRTLK